MTILKIRLIILIERLKKVTAVAEALGMKQPTVSFHMKKLEAEWGVPLFEYKTGKVLLTEAGKILHHYALQIDKSYSEAESRIAELVASGERLLTIGCTPLVGAALFTAGWFAEANKLPALAYRIVNDEPDVLAKRMNAGEIDLLLHNGEVADAGAQKELLLESSLLLFVSPRHPFASLSQIRTADLAAETYAAMDDSTLRRLLLEHDSVGAGIISRGRELGHPSSIMEAVKSGTAYSILPEALLAGTNGEVTGRPLPGRPIPWTVYAFWPRSHWNPLLLNQLLQVFISQQPK